MTTTTCPSCSWLKNDKRGRVTSFVLDGVTHYAADIWLGSRANRIEQEDGIRDAVLAFGLACGQWAEQCALQARYEAQQAARKAHAGRSVSTLSPVAQSLMAKHEACLGASA